MLDFNQIPVSKPINLIPVGTYYATIIKAEMRKPKGDPTKPEYLNLELRLKTKDGKEVGTIFDILSVSTNETAKYKLGRFIRATYLEDSIKAAGSFSLSDLQSAVDKTVIVDVGQEDAKNGYPAKNRVDMLSRHAYYLPTEQEVFDPDYAGTCAGQPDPQA